MNVSDQHHALAALLWWRNPQKEGCWLGL